jgi:hypothetical protein
MSNHLAVATVTAALGQLLSGPLGQDVAGAQVTMLGPNASGQGVPTTRVNLFLYQISPNAGLRNADLPMRDDAGNLAQRPTAAIDLHYIISCYGSESAFEPQLQLGSVLRTIQGNSILPRDLIRQAIGPNGYPVLGASDLADQIELVKLSPLPLSVDELSRLWSMFFGVEYTLSVTYQATVVLIDGSAPARTPLPVRVLPNIYVETFRQAVINSVTSAAGGAPISSGDVLILNGRNFSSNRTIVLIDGATVDPNTVTVHDVRISLPLPAGLRAGVHGVQVVHGRLMGTPAVDHGGVSSEVAPFVLQPKIVVGPTVSGVTAAVPNPLRATIQLTLDPAVGQSQHASLLLNRIGGGPAYNFVLPPHADSAALTFVVNGLKPGDYLVRVDVNGAQSSLTFNGTTYSGPKVTIP